MNRSHIVKDVIIALGIWWALAIGLGTLQLYGSYRQIYIIPAGIALMALVFAAHATLAQFYPKRAVTKYLLGAYIATFFIPLVMQFTRLRQPGIDTIIVALFGLFFFIIFYEEK